MRRLLAAVLMASVFTVTSATPQTNNLGQCTEQYRCIVEIILDGGQFFCIKQTVYNPPNASHCVID